MLRHWAVPTALRSCWPFDRRRRTHKYARALDDAFRAIHKLDVRTDITSDGLWTTRRVDGALLEARHLTWISGFYTGWFHRDILQPGATQSLTTNLAPVTLTPEVEFA